MDLVNDVRWIELDGAANVRDLGGTPTADGGRIADDRLIRADNLQGLSERDVRRLVDEHGVRAVADLRSDVEVAAEGPGPMTREPLVCIEHLSLFPESGHNTDAAADDDDDDDAPVVLPWQQRDAQLDETPDEAERRGASGIYLRYLDDRADSILAALRLVAHSEGATIVHCAAGKDRTGTVIALALAEVGVPRDEIAADYARSAERIRAIFARLAGSRTYAEDIAQSDIDRHAPKPQTMHRWLDAMDHLHGGVPAWLREHGWTDDDAAALRRKLLDPR
ncbi:MAG: tyrosine-protein phosphatase [Jatrophihabitans sp.]|uniref:tyrosine-protein phosphatase n=1 Tax=Jatrophihabitans sp. TaxID=1932789 RepID=UPI003F81D13C